MSIYAIGDLQGCDAELGRLLEQLRFCEEDQLWLVGDLINRGPASLQTLRRLQAMGNQCEIVLGNHDMHFLAIYFGGHKRGKSDTFDELLAAPDVDALAHWLRCQKLLHFDRERNVAMVHAGVPHIWSISQALELAGEVEQVIAGKSSDITYVEFFKRMYGNKPNLWNDDLQGMDRLRLITNYLTRMRVVDKHGALDFAHKGGVEDAPTGFKPWFEYVEASAENLVFGHWAALDGHTGRADILALDTGCVWGRQLTAINIETREYHMVPALAS